MSFLSKPDLAALLPSCIDPYDASLLESANYQLRLGDSYCLNPSEDGKVATLTDKDKQVVIKPGQFAFLITKETVSVPADCLALLSVKAGIKFRGLVNISGFHVDPGFKGKLKFSLFNAGPSAIVLERDRPYFLIWYCKLSSTLADGDLYKGDHLNQKEFTADDVMKLQGDIASPNILLEKIKAVEGTKAHLDWVLKILIGLVLAVLVRVMWMQSSSAEAEQALIEKTAQGKFDSAVEHLKLDSIVNVLSARSDSIYRAMLKDYEARKAELTQMKKELQPTSK